MTPALYTAFPTGDLDSIAIFQWLFQKGWPSGLSGGKTNHKVQNGIVKSNVVAQRGVPLGFASMSLPLGALFFELVPEGIHRRVVGSKMRYFISSRN